ncbi:hypothetical protein D3C75_1176790 [compost metagenome]
MAGQCGVFQLPVGQARSDQSLQLPGWHQVVAPADQAQQGIGRRKGKDVAAAQLQPDAFQAGDALAIGRGGEVGRVDRAYRRADHQIGDHAL